MTGRSPSNELTNGSDTFHITGNPAAALSITQGSLPTGLTFTDNGDGTATIAGAADPNQVGTGDHQGKEPRRNGHPGPHSHARTDLP
jgi:hypothetical protein